ncbi:hypothetical protein BV898_19474 [Hypsibius exemplaris]|uniref:SET domain-containing protein n=1 Tax=Hypsibius exemplaris TaxID=2072580 RepID=A0A9X6NS89_HYPEX|nr:hypothetical protein BV898_19474 [Hypsibius exemplaris]
MDAAAEGSSEVANTLMLLPHNLQLIVQPTGAKTCERKIHARCLINTSTVFGPLIAPRRPITLRPASPPASVLPLLTAADLSLIESFDVSSNATCNWMKFVRFAMRDGLANMEAVQRRGQLFFHVTRDIPRGDELIVALSPSFIASHRGVGEVCRKYVVARHARIRRVNEWFD